MLGRRPTAEMDGACTARHGHEASLTVGPTLLVLYPDLDILARRGCALDIARVCLGLGPGEAKIE